MSTLDGKAFDETRLNLRSRHGPALAQFREHLYLAWQPYGGHTISIVRSSDGVSFDERIDLSFKTKARPALAASNEKLYLGWQNKNHNVAVPGAKIIDENFVYYSSSDDGVFWDQSPSTLQRNSERHLAESVCYGGPALVWASHDGELIGAWADRALAMSAQ